MLVDCLVNMVDWLRIDLAGANKCAVCAGYVPDFWFVCVCSTISTHAHVLYKSQSLRMKLNSTASSPSISLKLPAPLIHSVACSYSSEYRAEKMRESTPK